MRVRQTDGLATSLAEAPDDVTGVRLPALHPVLARQYRWRIDSPSRVGLKVNLYRAWEVHGLALGLAADDLRGCPLECLMVGDSYLTTHLGRESTALAPADRETALATLVQLVSEVRAAINTTMPPDRLPFLVGDLPDGASCDLAVMLQSSEKFIAAGADAVKIEANANTVFWMVEAAAEWGVPVVVHLGYTPQRGSLARYGNSVAAAHRMFALARRARDSGACAIVLEMVSEAVNRALSRPSPDAVPVYSIFSGRAPYGGQSLNVWDAVFRPSTSKRFFPPTATLDAQRDLSAYTPELIADRMATLIRLTLRGDFPLSPPTALSAVEQELIASIDAWACES